jgi:tetratricopeptide (TPR) repeat protein
MRGGHARGTLVVKYLSLLLLLIMPACVHLQDAFHGQVHLLGLRNKPTPRAEAMAHYMAAVIHERRGRFDQAMHETRAASRLAPEAQTLQVKLIAAHLRLQEFEEARLVAERAVAVNPDDYMSWVWLGVANQQLGDFEKAAQALQRAIKMDPENVLGYEALAAVQEETNDWIGAIDLYNRLLEMVTDSPALHYQLGLSYVRIGQPEQAEQHLQKAIAMNPSFANAHYVLGLALFEQEKLQESEASLRRYLLLSPTDVNGVVHLAAVLARQARYDEALALLRLLASLENADPAHVLYRDFVLLAADEERNPAAPSAAEQLPFLSALVEAAALERGGGDLAPGLAALEGVQGDLEAELEEHVGQLVYYFGEEEVSRVLEKPLQRIYEAIPHAPATLLLGLARVHMALEKDTEAEQVLLSLVNDGRADKLAHHYLAIIYDAADDFDAAEQHMQKCLEYDPDDPELMNFLGYLYAENDVKLDDAERLLKRALETDPDNGFYLDSLGWVYYKQGRGDLAVEYIRKAILSMEMDDAELREHLGDAYLLDGQVEKAVREWERAYRLDPEREGVKEKLEQYAPDSADAVPMYVTQLLAPRPLLG